VRTANGVLVDERLETSVPGVFAAGDVASAWHPFYGYNLRVEHWANALNQGPVAAKAMLGADVSYDEIPYFFSDQYDSGMEYSGNATGSDEVVFRGDPSAREFIAFWLKDERVVAGMNMNIWDVSDEIRTLIRSRQTIDRRGLSDPDVPLASMSVSEESAARAGAPAEALSGWVSEGGAL
jgi:3-phenylpropionate/trans-cinnamate dioxygenase ferredoxin reductase subunit